MRLFRALTLCVFLFSLAAPALAQSGITLQADTTTLDFPKSLTFQADFASSATIDRVLLHYGSNAQSCGTESAARQTIEFEPGTTVEAEWEWDWITTSGLPPGVEVWWYWEVRDEAGNALTTERQTLEVTDDAYDWQEVSGENVTIYWSDGRRTFGEALLDETLNSLERLTVNAGLVMTRPIEIWVYPSGAGVQAAVPRVPEWTGGIAFSPYGVILAGIPRDDLDWAAEIIPHELTHLVTGAIVSTCFGATMPTWLEEGLAVYSEGPIESADRESLENALAQNRLPPLRELANGFSAYSDRASLDYLYSGEVVRHLATEHGAENIAQLLNTLRSGQRIDAALQAVYGFDTNELDAEWRAAWGFAITVVPTSVRPTRTAVPTLAFASATPRGTTAPRPTAVASATAKPAATAEAPATAVPANPPGSAGPCASAALVLGLVVVGVGLKRKQETYKH